jgi:hypothetical protein
MSSNCLRLRPQREIRVRLAKWTPLLTVLLVGCDHSGKILIDFNDLKPAALISGKQELVLGGTKLPVTVQSSNSNGIYEIDLMANDVAIDKEVYDVHPDVFNISSMGEETFNPPLSILKNQTHIGDSWTWTGKLDSGMKRDCRANISSHSEKLFGSEQADAIVVVVELKMDSGGPTPAERQLRFWFAPGKGLLKREFGSGSVREPVSTP